MIQIIAKDKAKHGATIFHAFGETEDSYIGYLPGGNVGGVSAFPKSIYEGVTKAALSGDIVDLTGA